jgi:hypothetical protein
MKKDEQAKNKAEEREKIDEELGIQDELASEKHSEFKVSKKTESMHRCWIAIESLGVKNVEELKKIKDDPETLKICMSLGVTIDWVIKEAFGYFNLSGESVDSDNEEIVWNEDE